MSKQKRNRAIRKAPNQRSPLSRRKKLLYGLVTTSTFFLVLEGALFLFGVEPAALKEDPYVGFTGRSPLFVAVADNTRLATAQNKLSWFNEQSFARKKRADTYRVFCLGGSTTYGRPYDDATSFCGWLREFLNAADSSHSFEVINAGGISYASYRVASVLEEVLQYSPDLIVVYTGHNEFLEHRTYKTIREMPALLQQTHAILSRTHTYSFLKETLAADSTNPVDARHMLPAEVKTRLDDGIGPDAFERDELLEEKILEQFAFNLHRMVDLARQAGCDVLLVAPAANLRHCSPFKSVVDSGLSEDDAARVHTLVAQANSFLADQNFAAALEASDLALAIDGRCAAAHFARGTAFAALEKFSAARDAFMRARDEDICALRATSEMGDIVRQVAQEERVPLVDFQQIADKEANDRIPGEDLFLDHVHPTIECHRILGLAIANELLDRDLVPIQNRLPPELIERVTTTVMGRVDKQANGDALRNLAKVFRWAGKTEEADRMALRADSLVAGDSNVLYLAANALLAKGEVDAAIRKLNEATQLNAAHAPSWLSLGVALQRKGSDAEAIRYFSRALQLDPNNLMALNNLASMYVAQQQWELAIEHLQRAIKANPRYAKAHHNLGIVHAKQQQWEAAIRSLEQSITISPESVQPRVDIANIYRSQGQLAKAVSHYRRAVQINPELVQETNTLSWLLATTADPAVRDGKEALRLALQCAEKTNYKNPAVFNTLAAAYAEMGDFEKAVHWQTEALEAAPDAMKPICRRRLEVYQARRPFRQGAGQ